MDETDAPASSAQNVLAVSGVAYGVIGADLHVFGGNGVPVYRLANWRPHPAPAARTDRHDELEQLRRWRDWGSRLQLRWLYGADGQGKSRLADQFAAESVQAGWKVVAATDGPGSVPEPAGRQDLRPDSAPGCLVIVGNADRWPLNHLTWLFSNTLFHRAGPARVLLLARTDDSWPRLRAAVACLEAGTSSQFLE